MPELHRLRLSGVCLQQAQQSVGSARVDKIFEAAFRKRITEEKKLHTKFLARRKRRFSFQNLRLNQHHLGMKQRPRYACSQTHQFRLAGEDFHPF